MNTLIFAGLFLSWLAIVRERSRGVLLACWWALLLASLGLLAHHLSGGFPVELTP